MSLQALFNAGRFPSQLSVNTKDLTTVVNPPAGKQTNILHVIGTTISNKCQVLPLVGVLFGPRGLLRGSVGYRLSEGLVILLQSFGSRL